MKFLPDLPLIPRPSGEDTAWARQLSSTLSRNLSEIAFRGNRVVPKDGSEAMTGPLVLASYLKAALPAAASYTGGLIFVSNETGGATVAFSDGTNWRRVQDRAVVS